MSLPLRQEQRDDLPLERQHPAGFVLPPFDGAAAIRLLDQMAAEADPRECDETLEYLMKALNETRAAGGERLLFPELQ